MNTAENNKLIAEFMGCKPIFKDKKEYQMVTHENMCYSTNELQYHKDWNWLMEVVQKINDQNNVVQIHENHVMVVNNTNAEVLVNVVSGSMLEATYEAVVQYIKLKEKKL